MQMYYFFGNLVSLIYSNKCAGIDLKRSNPLTPEKLPSLLRSASHPLDFYSPVLWMRSLSFRRTVLYQLCLCFSKILHTQTISTGTDFSSSGPKFGIGVTLDSEVIIFSFNLISTWVGIFLSWLEFHEPVTTFYMCIGFPVPIWLGYHLVGC